MFAAKAPKASSPVVPKEKTFVERPNTSSSSLSPSRDKSSFSTMSFDSEAAAWTPLRDNGAGLDYPELNGGKDIDDESIYSKNERTLVAYFGPLPREAEEALNKAGT